MAHSFLHPFCDRTVTLYGMVEGKQVRREVYGCYYAWKDVYRQTAFGPRFDRQFLLILPEKEEYLAPGWRVLDGIGPETVDWDSFLPVSVPTLSEVAYVQPWYLAGKLSHTEAGRK